MDKTKYRNLAIGDLIHHKNMMEPLIVVANHGGFVYATSFLKVVAPHEWNLVTKNTKERKETDDG